MSSVLFCFFVQEEGGIVVLARAGWVGDPELWSISTLVIMCL